MLPKKLSTESHNSLSLCEGYHSVVCRVYNKIKTELAHLPKQALLSLAVLSINKINGPEGKVPTVLLFVTHPLLTVLDLMTKPTPKKQRFETMKLARHEMETIPVPQGMKSALKTTIVSKYYPLFEFGDSTRIYRE